MSSRPAPGGGARSFQPSESVGGLLGCDLAKRPVFGPTFAFQNERRRPRGRTVVSLTRPICSGKTKLRPNELWSLARSGRSVRLDLAGLVELGQLLRLAE